MGPYPYRKKKIRIQTRKLRGGNTEETDNIVCPPPRCQCSESCKNPVKKGDTFCEVHTMQGCPIQGGISGYEPDYRPGEYNNDKAIQHSHNCFAYSLRVKDGKKIQECRTKNKCKFHVPGKTRGHPEFSGQMGKTCGDVIGRTLADIPGGYVTNFESPCGPGYSKIAVVVDDKQDLHYYSFDKPDKRSEKIYNGYVPTSEDSLASHKPGGRKVTDRDAYGALIYRPDLASRCYPKETPEDSGLNYNSFCSYVCVPRTKPIVIAGGGNKKSTMSRMKTYRSKRNNKRTRRLRGGMGFMNFIREITTPVKKVPSQTTFSLFGGPSYGYGPSYAPGYRTSFFGFGPSYGPSYAPGFFSSSPTSQRRNSILPNMTSKNKSNSILPTIVSNTKSNSILPTIVSNTKSNSILPTMTSNTKSNSILPSMPNMAPSMPSMNAALPNMAPSMNAALPNMAPSMNAGPNGRRSRKNRRNRRNNRRN